MKAKLEAIQQESAASAKKAQAEASRIIDEARKSAKEFLEKQTQESAAKANDILVRAQQVIELEKRKICLLYTSRKARLFGKSTRWVARWPLTPM